MTQKFRPLADASTDQTMISTMFWEGRRSSKEHPEKAIILPAIENIKKDGDEWKWTQWEMDSMDYGNGRKISGTSWNHDQKPISICWMKGTLLLVPHLKSTEVSAMVAFSTHLLKWSQENLDSVKATSWKYPDRSKPVKGSITIETQQLSKWVTTASSALSPSASHIPPRKSKKLIPWWSWRVY